MRAQIFSTVRFKCFAHHQWAEVGTADPDVNNVADCLAGVPDMLAVAYRIGEAAHQSQHALHIRHDIFALHINRMTRTVAQCGMQGRALFGDIYFFATEHALDAVAQLGLLGERHQQLDGFSIDTILGVIEKQTVKLQ